MTNSTLHLLLRILILSSLLTPEARMLRAQEIRIDFLDVGQGDATLIRTEGRTILIDAGPDARILNQLRKYQVHSLDLVIASHNHLDHIGGMPAVLANLPVQAYLDNGTSPSLPAYQRTSRLLQERRIPHLPPTKHTFLLGGVRIDIHTKAQPPRDPLDQNNQSLLVLLQSQSFRAAFPGDAERPEIADWTRSGILEDVTVLKASHHGSSNGLTPLWIQTLHPRYVVISAGIHNPYHHPHPLALRYYGIAGSRIYRTDQQGSVHLVRHSNGQVTLQTERIDTRNSGSRVGSNGVPDPRRHSSTRRPRFPWTSSSPKSTSTQPTWPAPFRQRKKATGASAEPT